ncbi:MAG: Holliday junction branch migration protein RuvA [Firmicutes bacterium]|nr:Holliday junction branch migration protein RuvA [Bacillota bacterium]
MKQNGGIILIGYLDGQVQWYKGNTVIVNINGIGYYVEVTDAAIIPEVGKGIKLYIYTYVREDALSLYGFKEIEERELFTTLLTVSGIGPKAALNILATLSYDSFINSILTENLAVLKQVSGIGPKTARRLILELQGKVGELANNLSQGIIKFSDDEEIHLALQGLGYSPQEIKQTLSGMEFAENTTIEEKIKKALTRLGKER